MLIDSLEWLGHSGFRVRTRAGVVYIDPYRVADGPKADLILITHGHYDHFSPQDVERLSHERTWLVGPPAVAERVNGRVHSLAPGEILEDELNVRGERLYHSGDTDVIPEMDTVAGVDVALLPVSGIYVMTAEEAAEAARRIQPRTAIPMHWGEHIGTREDAESFAEKAPVDVRILEPVS